MEDFHLLQQIAVALGIGLGGGLLARAVGLAPVVGYLAAGMVIGPFTPGYTGDVDTLQQLADLGIIFLMFGVGLHFDVADLMSVRKVAVPGALLQMVVVVGVVMGLGLLFDMPWRERLVLGLALSISSTVIAVRALEDRGMLPSAQGRLVIGWLIVQDLATVLFLGMLPALASGGPAEFVRDASIDIGKAAVFLAVMLFVGARILPKLLALIAKLGSRELFILSVVAAALGVAAGAAAFGLSVALGAFVGGVVVSERETSHQAAADVVPLREAFAVLFFVSVGMLLDPEILIDRIGLVLAVSLVVIVVKGLGSVFMVAAFPYPVRTAFVAGAALAQVGEFSFIIAQQGLDLGLLTKSSYNAVLAAAIISITLNPAAFAGIPVAERGLRLTGPVWRWATRQGPALAPAETASSDHVVIAGYGRVGQLTGHALMQMGIPIAIIDSSLELVQRLTAAGLPAIWGDAASRDVLQMAGVERARLVAVCVPDESTCLLTVANVRAMAEAVPIVVRARNAQEVGEILSLGANEVVVPEYEGGLQIMRQALVALGYEESEVMRFSLAVRDIHYGDR